MSKEHYLGITTVFTGKTSQSARLAERSCRPSTLTSSGYDGVTIVPPAYADFSVFGALLIANAMRSAKHTKERAKKHKS